ncbi:MAG: flagellar hook assembly protein FlgD [Synergistaceae bacterium]|nr:flagellar hook assembly protein FlgD [Synergistaceae bacterium]MBP9626883.1 flagellar hook assembly protein FlgD [Synergistaceae bacterium]MBP9958368.1 flagellar hook assembly protein FlgD [Synergistaceae bacterium]
MPNSITGTSSNINYFDDGKNKAESSLDKDSFLKLLVAQMTHQDPTNPMPDTEFVAQLATFNALEQQITTNKNLETLVQLNSSSAVGYIGRLVSYTDAAGKPQADTVQFIEFNEGKVYLYFKDETKPGITLDQVQAVG